MCAVGSICKVWTHTPIRSALKMFIFREIRERGCDVCILYALFSIVRVLVSRYYTIAQHYHFSACMSRYTWQSRVCPTWRAGELQPMQYSALDQMALGCAWWETSTGMCVSSNCRCCGKEVVFETRGTGVVDECGKFILHRRGTVSEKQCNALHMCICVSTWQYLIPEESSGILFVHRACVWCVFCV